MGQYPPSTISRHDSPGDITEMVECPSLQRLYSTPQLPNPAHSVSLTAVLDSFDIPSSTTAPRLPSLDRLQLTPEQKQVIKAILITPQCVDPQFRRRPCLVLSCVINESLEKTRVNISPVTKFDDCELKNTGLSDSQKMLFLPIFPNSNDVLHREALKTQPLWRSSNAYQMIQSLQISASRIESSHHVTTVCDEADFERFTDLIEERRNSSITPIRPPRPVHASTLNPHAAPFQPYHPSLGQGSSGATAVSSLNPNSPFLASPTSNICKLLPALYARNGVGKSDSTV
jgi:hypothetical protein